MQKNKGYYKNGMVKKLIRQRDKHTSSGVIKFIEFNEEGRGKALHESPEVGYACIVNPSLLYTWMTSRITEVISKKEFKTNNSHYKIEE